MTENLKTYFLPGDKVTCNKLPGAPEMYVIRKKEVTLKIGTDSTKTLLGIICRYLDKLGIFREEIFSTKDLTIIE